MGPEQEGDYMERIAHYESLKAAVREASTAEELAQKINALEPNLFVITDAKGTIKPPGEVTVEDMVNKLDSVAGMPMELANTDETRAFQGFQQELGAKLEALRGPKQ